jgi:hypothetical protein
LWKVIFSPLTGFSMTLPAYAIRVAPDRASGGAGALFD